MRGLLRCLLYYFVDEITVLLVEPQSLISAVFKGNEDSRGSVLCPLYLRLGLLAFVLPVTTGACVAFRTLWMRKVQADHMSWYIWAFWLISLYILP